MSLSEDGIRVIEVRSLNPFLGILQETLVVVEAIMERLLALSFCSDEYKGDISNIIYYFVSSKVIILNNDRLIQVS